MKDKTITKLSIISALTIVICLTLVTNCEINVDSKSMVNLVQENKRLHNEVNKLIESIED